MTFLVFDLSGRWDLNPRHPPWEGGVLPLNYSRAVIGLYARIEWRQDDDGG